MEPNEQSDPFRNSTTDQRHRQFLARVIMMLPTIVFFTMMIGGAIILAHDLVTTIGCLLLGCGAMALGYWETVKYQLKQAQDLERMILDGQKPSR